MLCASPVPGAHGPDHRASRFMRGEITVPFLFLFRESGSIYG